MSEAADRLKHRLNTGTLGGDQDSRDVQQVIAENEQLREALRNAEKRELAVIADLDEMTADRNLWWKREGIAQEASSRLEAALAQKTRECEEKTAELEKVLRFNGEHLDWLMEHVYKRGIDLKIGDNVMRAVVGHYEAQVEQLERQVAAWKVEYERVDGTNQALASECTDLRRQVAELSKPVTEPEERLYAEDRCQICGWPLAPSVEQGCVVGNCSYRPSDNSPEWHRLRKRREWIAARAALPKSENPL